MYRFTEDVSIIKEFYPAMERYLNYLNTQADNDIYTIGLGDWNPPKKIVVCDTRALLTCYAKHTTLKSEDMMTSELFLTVANHGAMMLIDAIDPVGTMDARVYEHIGKVFEKQIPYESYLNKGKPIEDVGIFYSLNKHISQYRYNNHLSAVVAGETFLQKHVCYGVVGTGCDISRFKTFVAHLPHGQKMVH